MKTQEIATKAMYAVVGAPVVATRMAKEYGVKLVGYTSKVADSAQDQFEELASEGEKVVGQLRSRNVVDDLQSRVDLEKVQGKVDRLRDQLESALSAWRESFTPEVRAAAKPASKAAKKPAAKPAARPTGKTATGSKVVAKPAAKASASKPSTAKTSAKTTTKKAPAGKTTTK